MNKLGIQWQIEDQSIVDYNQLIKPCVLKGINSRSRSFWERLKADNSESVRIYRHYSPVHNGNFPWAEDPERQAREAVNELRQFIGIAENRNEYLLEVVTHVEDNNEFIHAYQTDLWEVADRYMEEFMRLAKEELGLGTVFLNAATGNFSADLVHAFPGTIQTAFVLNSEGGPEIFIGFHEYDAPTMDRIHLEDIAKGGGGYWHCGRWKRAARAIRDIFGKTPKFIITECGVDFGVLGQHGKGFRSIYPPDLDASVRSYAGDHSLRWYKKLLDEDVNVFGATIFLESGGNDWADFDIKGTEVPRFIVQMPDWTPEQPNGGDMDIKVYDFDHSPFDGPDTPCRDMAWLRSIFGDIQVHDVENRTALQQGDPKLKVAWFDCKVGDTAIIVHVDDQDGNPKSGVIGVFGWPDAEAHELPRHWNLWTGNGTVGVPTHPNGDAGLGSYGQGAYYDVETGRGPHFVWLHSLPSDMVDGLGMLTWVDGVEGNHLHVNIGYRIITHGEDEEPPPPTGDVAGQIVEHAQAIIGLAQGGQLGGIAEIRAVDGEGNVQVFVPKTGGILARILGK